MPAHRVALAPASLIRTPMAISIRHPTALMGVQWTRDAFRLFMRRPLPFAGMFVAFLLSALLVSLVPLVGSVIMLMSLPLLSLGFMRLLGPAFLGAFGGRIVNSHPALLPAFPGAHAVRDALRYGVKVTGCTVHFVDAGVDSGPIIAQEPLEVLPSDDEAALHERIKVIERRLIVDVVGQLVRHGYTISDRKVTIP